VQLWKCSTQRAHLAVETMRGEVEPTAAESLSLW
jgi:hypothetical protein